jgi:DNA repair exonuclease SbcCD ATPase subunit
MTPPGIQPPLFDDLVADLPDHHKAEFFQNLYKAGISPNDVELARLLRSLQLYKAYYESIPASIQTAAAEIERLKQEIDRLGADARRSSETSATVARQVIQEAEHFRQELAKIHEHIEEVTRSLAEDLAGRMAELLNASLEQSLLQPLESRLAELASSNSAFADTIASNDKAAATLRENAAFARSVHFGAYALAAFLIACALSLGSWFSLHRWYKDRIETERAALVQQVEKNRTVLLKLAESRRTLELRQDPEHPKRRLLVMKDASCWESTRNQGVIEFNH